MTTNARISLVLTLATLGAALATCTTTPTGPGTATQPAVSAPTTQPGRGFGRGGFGRGGVGRGGFGRGGFGAGQAGLEFPFQDDSLPLEQRVADLIGRLTLEEKAAQLQMAAPAVERLGIPPYHWWNEALHGVARNGEATVFPQAIAMAATWNTELHYRMGQVIAVEGRAKHEEAVRQGIYSIYTGLDMWSPNINIFRDPRWGRGQETYGEDPYLTGRFGVAFVTGLQGNDPFYFHTIATPKHYAVHSGPEMERHRFNAQPSQVDLWTTYLPAFEACVREGKAYSVMASYNRVLDLPATASPYLLTDILRNQWGFQGYVTSDVDSVADVYRNHQFSATPEEAAAASLKAGCDLNGGTTYRALTGAVKQGLLTEKDLDKALTRLFTARFRLGLFDSPEKVPYANTAYSRNNTPEHDRVALQAARESMVLLKNDNNTLPLKKENIRTLAVIGPTADSLSALVGNYNGDPSKPSTFVQGLRDALGTKGRVLYTPGCPIVTEQVPLEEAVPAACLFADASLKTPGLAADYYGNTNFSGRAIRTRYDAQVDFDWRTGNASDPLPIAEGFSARWTGFLVPPQSGEYQLGITARDGFRLILDGKTIVDEWLNGNRRTTGQTVRLEAGKPVPITVEYYHPRGSGGGGGGGRGGATTQAASNVPPREDANIRLAWTRPLPSGEAAGADGLPLFADALRAVEASDAVVLVLGITADLEREEHDLRYQGFSGGDRTSLDLPAVQQRLMEGVVAAAGRANKPVVLALTSGSALSVTRNTPPAIIEAWYPGQRGGDAFAEILFGQVNPGGKLPVTFYRSVDDLPAFTDYRMAAGPGTPGRTYRYFTGTPLYPFGHGLSYTTFQYGNITLSTQNPATSEDVKVTVPVRNTGPVAGDEVVQVYLGQNPGDALTANGGAVPPLKTLVGFKRVSLKPGEQKTVEFTLTPLQFALVTADGKRHVYPTPVTLHVGGNSMAPAGPIVTFRGEPAEPTFRFVPPVVKEGTP
jgi:beta-glucosidase